MSDSSWALWDETEHRLLSGLRHQLNNRVTALGGLARLAVEEPGLDEESRQMLLAEAARMEQLVALLHRLPGPPRGAAAPVDTGLLLVRAVELGRRMRGLERLDIRYHADDCPAVTVDADALVRLLLVVLWLAGEAAPAGALDIATESRDDVVRITIGGAGVPTAADSAALVPLAEAAGVGLDASDGVVALLAPATPD